MDHNSLNHSPVLIVFNCFKFNSLLFNSPLTSHSVTQTSTIKNRIYYSACPGRSNKIQHRLDIDISRLCTLVVWVGKMIPQNVPILLSADWMWLCKNRSHSRIRCLRHQSFPASTSSQFFSWLITLSTLRANVARYFPAGESNHLSRMRRRRAGRSP